MRSFVKTVLVAAMLTVSTFSATASVTGSDPRPAVVKPQGVTGSDPRPTVAKPQGVTGSDPRPTSVGVWSSILAFFGLSAS